MAHAQTEQVPVVAPQKQTATGRSRLVGRWFLTITILGVAAVIAVVSLQSMNVVPHPEQLSGEVVLAILGICLVLEVAIVGTLMVDRIRVAQQQGDKLTEIQAGISELRSEIRRIDTTAAAAATGVADIQHGLGGWRGVQQRLESVQSALEGLPGQVRHEVGQETMLAMAYLKQMTDKVDHQMESVQSDLARLPGQVGHEVQQKTVLVTAHLHQLTNEVRHRLATLVPYLDKVGLRQDVHQQDIDQLRAAVEELFTVATIFARAGDAVAVRPLRPHNPRYH